MDTSNNTSIISKFISKEVENLYSKYNRIPEEEINIVRNFIDKVEANSLDFNPYLNYKATKELAVICDKVEDIDLIRYYICLRYDVSIDISLEDAKETYKALNDEGYCKIKGYYLYKNEQIMKELGKDELDTKLEDAYEVTNMFNIEEIADMWIFGTSKEEAAKQYLRDNNWYDILECEEPEEGYTDSCGEKIYYCYIVMEGRI